MASSRDRKYSCNTAAETLEWINAIVQFIRPYSFLINAHVVNFFKDRLWEGIDQEWTECLRYEPIENLLMIPSGVVQDYWPALLKEFILTTRSLVFPREQADLQAVSPGLHVASLNTVLSQGMNLKKKHEVEILSAITSSIAKDVRAHTIVDVGAGQGYLAQVLSFQYELPVIAIDACSHHGKVTNARAERIKKHYNAQMHKSLRFGEMGQIGVPIYYSVIAFFCTVGAALAIYHIYRHLLNYTEPTYQGYIVRIIFMVPDITTLLLDTKAFKDTIDLFVERYKDKDISVVAGFILQIWQSYTLPPASSLPSLS